MSSDDGLLSEEQRLLQAALTNAFSPPPLPREAIQSPVQPKQPESTSQVQDAPIEPESSSSDDPYKQELEAMTERFRAENKERTARQEKIREYYEREKIREEQQAKARGDQRQEDTPTLGDSEWESVGQRSSLNAPPTASPSPADARDLVAGESEKKPLSKETQTHQHSSHFRQETGDDSQKWEDVPSSLTSSFPSMSFHEITTDTSSPPQNAPAPAAPPPPPLSATVTIFDSSLPTRTRVNALLSSLAINLLLPFVNGVMLGFGEIFARNVVLDWLGWKSLRPGTVAARTGLGGKPPEQWQRRPR